MRDLNLGRFAFLLALATNAFAQYQTPVVDGTINSGEYANQSGNWSMTWDATYLYIGITGNADSDLISIYLDVDPLSTPRGGTDADGSLIGHPDAAGGPVATLTPTLPFRADARLFLQDNGNYRLHDGSGGWGGDNGNPADIFATRDGTTHDWEVRIRWEPLGLTGIPSSFLWLGYKNSASEGNTAATDPMPPANPTGTSIDNPYFFSVASTADGASSNPFATRQSTWRVTSNADSGASTLRQAVTNANADTASSRRFITFAMSTATITTTTALPTITTTTTIDGTTQTGGTTPAVILVGPGTGSGVVGIRLSGVASGVVRGLVVQNYATGIAVVSGGTANTIAGNFIGTNATGDAAAGNQTGIAINGCSGCTVGGAAATDRNVIASANVAIALTSDTNTVIENNYIGTNAAGSAALSNTEGINSFLSTGLTIGSSGAGNVISGNSDAVIISVGIAISFYGNKVGVGADGTTAIGNGNAILSNDAVSNLVIGSTSAPNIIANNGTGVNIENGGGLLVRGNSFFANTSPALAISGVIQPAPTISAAEVTEAASYITFSLTSNSSSATTLSMRVDAYTADTANATAQGKTYRATSPCYAGSSLTNQQWVASAGFTAGEKIVLIATSYSDANCTTAGDGSSAFTPLFTTTALPSVTFTGPGSFSDTTKWSGAALPITGQDFVVVSSCTFDSGAPNRTYGSMTLGSGATPGSMTWAAGNDETLHVRNISSAVAGGTLTMTDNDSTLRIDGVVTTTNLSFAADGIVEYGGTSQIIVDAVIYDDLRVLPGTSATFSNTLNAEFIDVAGSLSGNSGSILSASTVDGSGSIALYDVQVASGNTLTAATSFAVSHALTVEGTVVPFASAIISGSGTLSGSGMINVKGTATNSLASQYALSTRDLSALTVAFTGAAEQSVDAITYSNLTINNAAGATISQNVTVNGTLALTAGILRQIGGDGLFITNASPSAVTVGSGWLRSVDLTRAFATGTNTYLYPTGTADAYAPATVTIQSATAAGNLLGFGTNAAANFTGSGIDPLRNANFVWLFRLESGAFPSHDMTLSFGTLVDAGAAPDKFVVRKFATSAWSTTTATPGATSISVTGLTAATAGAIYALGAGNQLIDHYVVSATSPQTAGTPFMTTVTAEDLFNVTANDSTTVVTMTDTGSCQFDGDGNGAFGDNTKSLVNGAFTISTKDNTIETTTLTATDANGKTGASGGIVINLGPASTATTTITPAQPTLTANGTSSCAITVQLKDAGGNNLTTDAATVALSTTSGSLGSVSYAGNGSYTATFTAGTLAGDATITGTLGAQAIADNAVVVQAAGPVAALSVVAPANATGGSAFNVLVAAVDAHGNGVIDYLGTVQITSSATSATLPSNYTYVGSDGGVHTFSVTLSSAGNIVVTARDTVTASITGSDTVAVTGNTTTSLVSSANPSLVGQTVTFTATVSSTTTGTLTGTVTFKNSSTTLGTGSISGGTATYTTSSLTQGTHSITAEYGATTNFHASASGAVSQVVNLSPFGPPAILYATAANTSSVSLAWTPVSGATSYRIYRSSGGGPFTQFTSVATASHSDTGRSANTTYLYKVSADNGTTESDLSAVDAATTIVFTDSALSTTITVKKTHLDELRTAVNAMRTAAGLSSATFTDSSVTAQITPVKRLHLTELRTALDAARTTIGLPALTYTDSTITAQSTNVKSTHWTEVRAGTQ